jgi:hypothetical protein
VLGDGAFKPGPMVRASSNMALQPTRHGVPRLAVELYVK